MPHETQSTGYPQTQVNFSLDQGVLQLDIRGQLDASGTTKIWDKVLHPIRELHYSSVTVDCAHISYMNGAGLALLLKLKEEATCCDASVEMVNLKEAHQSLMNMVASSSLSQKNTGETERKSVAESLGRKLEKSCNLAKDILEFIGESTHMILTAILHPKRVRWKDVIRSCLYVGVDSFFIIVLIGFVMGLIMSFQSAVTLEKFGGQIFIPNMLGLVMFREMGPLVTSILLAARSGSAFAAEIGTMKVNEELDALTTMGLSPMHFLVTPRLLSALIMIPLMTIFFNIASLVGGALVMLSIGFPLVTYTSRVFAYVSFVDFAGGMFKAFIFAILVAGIGCFRGMQTKNNASSVGLATTSAVVSGIILIAFADGLFAIAFYFLGW